MKLQEFEKKTHRGNKLINDKLHFFSSKSAVIISFILFKLKLSANQVTFLFGLTGVLSANLFLHRHFIIGYLLWRLHIIIDMADGNIARASQKFNVLAPSIDKIIHVLVNTFIFGVLIILPSSISTNQNLIILAILLLPFYLIYMLFNKITDLDSALSYDYSKIKKNQFLFILIRNISTQEGLIFACALLGFFNKYEYLNSLNYEIVLVIIISFYILSFTLGSLFKLKVLKQQSKDK